MRQDDRRSYDKALRAARMAAYPPGEFVEQESFMRAAEILALARRAGIGPGVCVLDLCCGVAGAGRFITSQLGCTYLGVDVSDGAIELALARAAGLTCRFEVAEVPPIPRGAFDVVLLLETMLAFRDKQRLLGEVSAALVPGGRFAFTVEEGPPLTEAERRPMPDADRVWPIALVELVCLLSSVGLVVRWMRECTRAHELMAEALLAAFLTERSAIAAELGDDVIDGLVAAHRLWSDWMTTGRVRKFAIIAERKRPGSHGERHGALLRSPG